MRYLTASEMRLWMRCRRKWYLSQYRGLTKLGDPSFNNALGIGNRVHDALAVYYTPWEPGVQRADPLQFLAEGVAADLEKYPTQERDIREEGNLARIMLEGYFEWLEETGEDQALTVVEAEQAVTARLEPGRDVSLLTKLDARVDHDEYGRRLALEHKATADFKLFEPEMRMNFQALTEHLTEFMHTIETGGDPDAADGVLFNLLKKVKRTARAKPPFYKRAHVRHSRDELRNHWRHVVAIADQIQDAERRLAAGEDHHLVVQPNATNTCHWECEFFQQCPLMDGREDHELALLSKFTVGDPLKRYEGLLEHATD